MESKYKIGHRVKVKSIDWYNNNKDRFGSVAIGDKKPKFTYAMSKYCGQVLTVDDLSEYEGEYYMIEDDGVYTWADEMFEGVVDESDSEPDNIDKFIQRFGGNECKIALPEGYQFVDREGNIIDTSIIMVTKKGVEYPKDYNECCNVLDDEDRMVSLELMNELRKLINARNAFWKIYGEASGLGGSWKPDWDDGCYVITSNGDGLIVRDIQFGINAILAFPTAELRDMFYERFKT